MVAAERPESSDLESLRVTHPDTVELARAARNGDREALEELFQRYAPRVLEIARFRCACKRSRWAEYEDIAQDALVRAFKGLDGFEPDGSEGAFLRWLSTCVRTALLRQLEVERTQQHGSGRELRMADLRTEDLSSRIFGGNAPTPSAQARGQETAERLEELLLELPERDRDAIIDHRLCGMSYREMSAQRGLSEDNMRKMVSRALKKLASGLAS